jgi:hypothetical protein
MWVVVITVVTELFKMWTVARLRRVMFRNEGCFNYFSYKELFEMWIIARLQKIMFRHVGCSNDCSYGELFEMWM